MHKNLVIFLSTFIPIAIVAVIVIPILILRMNLGNAITPTDTYIPETIPEEIVVLNITTYNILNAFICQDSDLVKIGNRLQPIVNNIDEIFTDLFFLQEATAAVVPGQSLNVIDYIKTNLKSNFSVFQGKDRGDPTLESVPMYYRTDTLDVLITGSELFTSTSKCEDYPRVYTYGKFKTKIGDKVFWAFGTHMPTKNCLDLQKENADELIAKIKSLVNNDTYFIVADWNSNNSLQVNNYVANALQLQQPFVDPTHFQFNSDTCVFDPEVFPQPSGTLDRILTTLGPDKQESKITNYNGRFSDHNIPCSDHAAVSGLFELL
jgi:hypothetical protein